MNDPIQNPTAEIRDGILIIREHKPEPCMRCARPVGGEDYERLCSACAELMGPVLAMACNDHWRYTLGLKTGQQIVFSEIESIRGDWILLGVTDINPEDQTIPFGQNPARGVAVRLGDIIWAFDWDS